jgi:hypothetical protein
VPARRLARHVVREVEIGGCGPARQDERGERRQCRAHRVDCTFEPLDPNCGGGSISLGTMAKTVSHGPPHKPGSRPDDGLTASDRTARLGIPICRPGEFLRGLRWLRFSALSRRRFFSSVLYRHLSN